MKKLGILVAFFFVLAVAVPSFAQSANESRRMDNQGIAGPDREKLNPNKEARRMNDDMRNGRNYDGPRTGIAKPNTPPNAAKQDDRGQATGPDREKTNTPPNATKQDDDMRNARNNDGPRTGIARPNTPPNAAEQDDRGQATGPDREKSNPNRKARDTRGDIRNARNNDGPRTGIAKPNTPPNAAEQDDDIKSVRKNTPSVALPDTQSYTGGSQQGTQTFASSGNCDLACRIERAALQQM